MPQLYIADRKLRFFVGDWPQTMSRMKENLLFYARTEGLLGSASQPWIRIDRELQKLVPGRKRLHLHTFWSHVHLHATPYEPSEKSVIARALLSKRADISKAPRVSVAEFLQLARARSAGFLACKAGDPSEAVDRTFPVSNRLGRPGGRVASAAIRRLLGTRSAEWLELAKSHDGIELFIHRPSCATGIRLFPTAQWERKTKEMRRRYRSMFEDGYDDSPGSPLGGIAFGEVPHSGNYFTFQTSGRSVGRIFTVDHDGWDPDPIAPNLGRFLGQIVRDPAAFLYKHGCFLRFGDPAGENWIPVEYVPKFPP